MNAERASDKAAPEIVGGRKIVSVPMKDGRRLRFAVHPDGTVYELRRGGDRRVKQEPFRSELFAKAWPPPAQVAP